MTIFKYVGAGVSALGALSALGFLSIAEIIRQWVMGG
jgi:hypothetical protein